ncbi:MAG: cobyrinate a,c-diamide synthase, partial [Synergistaceae bacterium]|nr:cobyrinate a,c-diamide synthase [Synergistaceae bacterium]
PVVLVINARSMGESAAAVALGFREFDRGINLAGVILNFTGSDYHEEIIAEALSERGIKFLGALRRDEGLAVPERHLGLLQARENEAFDIGRLTARFESSVNVDEILRLAGNVSEIRPCCEAVPSKKYDVRVGVACDEAFTFVYHESLMTLEGLGAEIVPFSPLHDKMLPDADGYIFCGGYPEIFAEGLALNAPMLESVREAAGKKPVLAECGGMMYLCRKMRDSSGRTHDMAGVIPFDSYMAGRAVMGYMTGTALRDNLLCRKGESIRGHEHHYGRIEPDFTEETGAFELVRKNGGGAHYGGYSRGKVLASWLHVNFWGCPEFARRFADGLTSSGD